MARNPLRSVAAPQQLVVLVLLLFVAVLGSAWILRLQAPDPAAGCAPALQLECSQSAAAQSVLAVGVVAVVAAVAIARPRESAARVLLVMGLAFACAMVLQSWLWWQVD